MRAKGNNKLIRIELDADDLMQLINRITHKVMDSDKILQVMHKYNEKHSYADYLEVVRELGITPFEVVMTRDMAIDFSDELVSLLFADESIAEIYQLPTQSQKESHLKMARICSDCQKAYVSEKKGHTCDA
jgi:hypothetical protein